MGELQASGNNSTHVCKCCTLPLFLKADVCHAYQVLRRHGVPADNIIVMMYDDIANNIMYVTVLVQLHKL